MSSKRQNYERLHHMLDAVLEEACSQVVTWVTSTIQMAYAIVPRKRRRASKKYRQK